LAQQPSVGHGLLIREAFRSHSTTHHSRQDSSGRVISSSQGPLPDNTQHSQQTNIHAPGGIRAHNLSRREATDLRIRPRGHWDRLIVIYVTEQTGKCDVVPVYVTNACTVSTSTQLTSTPHFGEWPVSSPRCFTCQKRVRRTLQLKNRWVS